MKQGRVEKGFVQSVKRTQLEHDDWNRILRWNLNRELRLHLPSPPSLECTSGAPIFAFDPARELKETTSTAAKTCIAKIWRNTMDSILDQNDFLACCGSTKFAAEMINAGPVSSYEQAVQAAREIWMNKVDIHGWLEAFAAHPEIGGNSSAKNKSETSAQWSKGEQSTALATATDSTLQELYDWNIRYRQKFGFVFLICATGKNTLEILAEIKKRYPNKPIVELEIAAGEQLKIIELRLAKLFVAKGRMTSPAHVPTSPTNTQYAASHPSRSDDRLSVIGAHLTAVTGSTDKCSHISARSRPPITTHILDVSRGSPAAGVDVLLEMWKGNQSYPPFGSPGASGWVFQGSSVTNTDGRSGHLMNIIDDVPPGFYRISFNTGKYLAAGFFPYVSIVFEIKQSQTSEHFHVPLLLSPFSFTTYRGS